ncbi:family 78 glycoside hydrolase catalytic domain [Chitinophaga rhizophila]|uniref:alpha-L-rhamnosidase n=1 Tax=Chitinophaga rhizophila TaxID=2866212 RepID=A0ABS7G955_9BACT|nr:family 78 glycoside hydrolase catalytic domain [Chitinophaga rhizophila]MBW8684188.1 glycoside hydrolase family 78 protein [Chitinophaga rhizophila]
MNIKWIVYSAAALRKLLTFAFLLITCTLHAQYNSWQGSWITNTEDTTATKAPYFRKTFRVDKKIANATAYVAGVGYHIVYVNGRSVTDAVLEQAYTRYDKRLLYKVYDVTSLLSSKGPQSIAAELGNGWYNIQSHAVWGFQNAPWRNTPRLLLDLVIRYEDGTTTTIATDDSWKCATGPSQFNCLYSGEIYDARQEVPDWNQTTFNDASWKQAMKTSSPGGELHEQIMPSIKIIRHIKPVSVKKLGTGKYLFDMGQNFSGVATLRVKGIAGTKVTMYYGEVLKDGALDMVHNTEHMRSMPGELRFQTDVYYLKGGGQETFTPRFVYHGFQYVQVEADNDLALDKQSLEGLFYSTDFEEAGHFTSSDEMVNKLYEAARQSYRSNFLSIPTDCPQREKNGWTADAHISAEIGLWNYHTASSYRKWLHDVRDAQLPSGSMPGIAPSNGWGYDRPGNEEFTFGPAWGSALGFVTWYMYLYHGDTALVREHYDAFKKYTDVVAKGAEGYLFKHGLDDWMSLVKTPVTFTSTAYFYTDALLVAKMARVLGNKADEVTYTTLADSIRNAFNRTYFDGNSGHYKDSTMTALSAAVFHELASPDAAVSAAKQLAAKVARNNYHADFGVMGTKYVLPMLSEHGYADVAFRLLTDTGYAGWAHWIANGATTLFEDWPGELSHNHIFFGDYCAWFYKTLAGIRPDENAPGFKHFFIQPAFVQALNFVKADYNSRYGKIKVEWKRNKQTITLQVEVPSSATLRLPAGLLKDKSLKKVTIGNQPYEELTLGSGKYSFKIKA